MRITVHAGEEDEDEDEVVKLTDAAVFWTWDSNARPNTVQYRIPAITPDYEVPDYININTNLKVSFTVRYGVT